MTETRDLKEAAMAAVDAKNLQVPTAEDPQHYRVIAYVLAGGATVDQASMMTGVPAEEIFTISKLDRIQRAVQEIRERQAGSDHELLFKKMAPDAAETIRSVMQNPNANDSNKLSAAGMVLDRGFGRPKQNVEHGGSLIRQMIDLLHQEKETREIEGTSKRVDTEDGEFQEIDSEAAWVKEHL